MDNAPTIKLGVYRHSKSGKLYEVIGIAFETETQTPLVIYEPLYETDWNLFARPYQMFIEHVLIDGVSIPRFQLLDTENA